MTAVRTVCETATKEVRYCESSFAIPLSYLRHAQMQGNTGESWQNFRILQKTKTAVEPLVALAEPQRVSVRLFRACRRLARDAARRGVKREASAWLYSNL